MLHCSHNVEPFLSKGIKIPKLNSGSMELADYKISFVHIKGKHNILADTISRLKLLNIYEEASSMNSYNSQSVVTEICATSMHNIDSGTFCNEQKWDKTCKMLSQI